MTLDVRYFQSNCVCYPPGPHCVSETGCEFQATRPKSLFGSVCGTYVTVPPRTVFVNYHENVQICKLVKTRRATSSVLGSKRTGRRKVSNEENPGLNCCQVSDIYKKILGETFTEDGCGCVIVATCIKLLRVQPCNRRVVLHSTTHIVKQKCDLVQWNLQGILLTRKTGHTLVPFSDKASVYLSMYST